MGGAEKLRIKINRKKETEQLRGSLDNFIVKKQRTTEIISSTASSEKVENSLNNTTSSKISNFDTSDDNKKDNDTFCNDQTNILLPLDNNIFNTLSDVVTNYNTSWSSVLAVCFDGASTMSGKISGVQARYSISKKTEKKIKHRIVFDFLGTVQFLYNFIEGSPIRHATLEKISKESCIKLKTLKSLSNTKWACRAEAVSAVQENFSMLVPAIDEICENTQVPDVRAKGLGLKYQLKSFNFVFAMNLMEPIFRAVLKVSASLQAPVLDLLAAVEIVKGLKKFLSKMRNDQQEYDNIYQTTIDICNKNKIDIPEVLKRKVARKIDDNGESQFFSETKYDEIRINVFYPILDDLLGKIDNRFLDSTLEVITSVGNLIKLQPTIEDYSVIKTFFNILNKDLDSEVKILASIKDIPIGTCTHTIYKWLDWLMASNRKNIFTNFYEAITKFVVIPVTSCGCERAFSKLSIVKSKLRSTMSQERLESLLFLFVEQEMTKSVDFNTVIEEFKVLSPVERRLPL
ncbi:uncharacterized protein LOC132951771 [Metopolophium dirhodum]|uniref:uncharacterized protein LOC132951771 n=1 Tax=Metopolophium dirhodum TaxID=44670 RepID=UPI0029900736|nr:uncharacterized protein LOC132951771 [Metopolophium dirhodum]